ncbi:FAD:protein FMN transferase [Demequina flava]|uniref:FAD:protein FMN transferase n=1 Tax=Demequina flava TaxID=1095025 RepID=UPI000784EECE|nr:FAD:protein FMN transferase [Demequina flava]
MSDGPTPSPPRPTHARTVTAMAMDFTLTVVGDVADASLDTVMPHVDSDLQWVDAVFSTFREDSWISRMGAGAATVSDAPPAVAEVLDLCEHFREETGGHFDARTPDGRIDPTGIVKTWAMQRSAWRIALLGAEGWSWGCAGDIQVSGTPPTDAGWRIGVADPRAEPGPAARTVAKVVLGGGKRSPHAIATSGRATAGSIWTPRQERGAQVAQASVIGPDIVQCDAWATAIVAGGAEVARRAPKYGVEVLALRQVGERIKSSRTPGWPA